MIQPVIALIAWSMVMLVWLYARRLPAMMRYAVSEPKLDGDEAVRRLPPQVQWSADAYNNLLEQPTLFYALCMVDIVAGITTRDLEYFAWLYVALRVIHSVVQATTNIVVIRFCLFIASSGVLGLLCLMSAIKAFI